MEAVEHTKKRYTISETAKLLGTRREAVSALIKNGLLRTVVGISRPAIAAEDIDALIAHRESGPATVESASLRARAALARAVSLEGRLDALEYLLGLNLPGVECSTRALQLLVRSAQDDIRIAKTHAPKANKIVRWARTLYALNEEHLALLSELGKAESWEHFVDMAEALMRDRSDTSLETETARRYLRAALGHFRNTALVYLRRSSGSGSLRRPWLDEHMRFLIGHVN